MQIVDKRCLIGESPVWNEEENALYFTNGLENEIVKYDFESGSLSVIKTEFPCAALLFDKNNNMIVSGDKGVFLKNKDGFKLIYDGEKHEILHANDMKAGPDGRIYVGTQSEKRLGISDKIDGKLFCVDCDGKVTKLLDNLLLSNGMDWSSDGKYFYHTDSDTHLLKEYDFDIENGEIHYTGRCCKVDGIDGFSMDKKGFIYAACWGMGHVSVVDSEKMKTVKIIKVPCSAPASCSFAGKGLNKLAITTASFSCDIGKDKFAGYTFLAEINAEGRAPYKFGKI